MKTARATETFVVDASAMVKRFGAEEHWKAFQDWAQASLSEGARFVAPHLLRYELGNILVKSARADPSLTPEHRKMLLDEALVGVQFVDGDSAFDVAPPLSYYDASYLATAQAMKASLVSYDDKLLKAARKAGIKTLQPK